MLFLEISHLEKRYGSIVALAGLDLQVERGELFGLLGPNGAGKTTLLSILSCLLEPTAGEVRLLGEALTAQSRDVRRQIGIVPQEVALYGELTARENLRFFGQLYGMPSDRLARRVEEVLHAIGLEESADRLVRTFSGGMQRRLNFGAALVHEPGLLLLDEPTVGVDPQSRNRLFEEIRRVHKSGVTIIYTSHYMEEVQALCTRIGVIDHGKLVACDRLEVLLERLEGVIRAYVPRHDPELLPRIEALPGVDRARWSDGCIEVECRDIKTTLVHLISALNDAKLELLRLEMEEPNLERLFLQLTGRALRD